MTPTRLFEIACEESKGMMDLKELTESYKRVDSGLWRMNKELDEIGEKVEGRS